MVVVDRFSNYGTFVSVTQECPAKEVAQAFMAHVVKLWGLLESLVSDRDGRFTGKFWTELFKLLGSKLRFSTSFYP